MFKKLRSKIILPQKQLARWAAWFFLANAFLWILIASNYLSLLPKFNEIEALTWQGRLASFVFIVSSFLGYFSLVAYSAWLIVAICSWYRSRFWVFLLSIFFAAFLSLVLIVDSLIYHLFHFHLWGVVWSIVSSGVAPDVLLLSSREWWLIVGISLALLLVESVLAYLVWRFVKNHPRFKQAKSIGMLIGVAFFLSYALLVKSYAAVQTKAEVVVSTQLINLEAQLIPFYNNVMGLLLPEKEGGFKLQTRGGGAFLQLQQVAKPLNYPLHPLDCQRGSTRNYNILLIVVDALRYEALNAKVMPYLNQFAEHAWQFENHYSAGNATGPGIFSLFYSLPYNYWTAMLKQNRSPVLLDQLQKQGYELGIYRSASMEYPAFNKTVFAHVKSLQLNTPGNRAYLRDQKITEQFTHFLAHRNMAKPFFGFLFYDALHNYCQRPTPYAQIFQPAITMCNRAYLDETSDPLPYLNRYYNAAHFVDSLIEQVFTGLRKNNLLDNTIVVVTADHGEEFNDSQKNYWGHVSAYTDWQLHVPFILYWPGHGAKQISAQTTHYDFAPYLMQTVLGCSNPINDYSVGSSLLDPVQAPFFVANSYIDYAILTDTQVTRIYPQGNYLISDRTATPMLDSKLNERQLQEVFEELNRYFKNP